MKLVEVRKIIFSKEMLKEAFLNQCKEEGIEVPNSQIQDILIEGDDPLKVAIQFMTADPKNPIELKLNNHFILSSMILTCGDFGVPLPRQANKTIQSNNGGLAMVITISTEKK